MINSSRISDDPLSDILKFMNAQSILTGSLRAGGRWSITFEDPVAIKFFGILKGQCWFESEAGKGRAVRMEQGDVLLMVARRRFTLSSELGLLPLDGDAVFDAVPGKVVTLGDTEDCVVIGGRVELDDSSGATLTDVLPELIHVHADSPQASVLQWLIGQLFVEQTSELPGASLAFAQLAQLMFLQTLRAYMASAPGLDSGWLRALADAKLAPALRLMHGDPGRAWQLEELARAAAMSRTSFAVRFKSVAGVAPLTYLTEWRMRLAQRALRDSKAPLGALAAHLGYGSESAFSNAFKRVTGVAPQRFRLASRRARAGLA